MNGLWFAKSASTAFSFNFIAVALLAAAEPATSEPRPIPLTRPVMKQLLEDMKQRTPRIPLPELTEEEKAKLGERGSNYEGRLRSLYMPWGDSRGGLFFSGSPRPATGTSPTKENRPANSPTPGGSFGRESDPTMSLDYKFKTTLFWIASRANNCQYCLGHQESKLLNAGMTEDQIAALDSNWNEFSPAEQAAFAMARRLTLEPHLLSDADIDAVRKHYSEMQILEMILSVAGNNSINRWKEGVGVPQSSGGGGFGRRNDGKESTESARSHSYLTPTSEKYLSRLSSVVNARAEADSAKSLAETLCVRPPLESRTEVESALAKAAARKPRLPVVDEAKAREILAEVAPEGSVPQWMRLLANFPSAGKRNAASIRSADEKGDLTPLLKAQVSWIIARQDRAWYATGQAKRRLAALGQSDDQMYALDGNWNGFAARDRALFTVAQKLAASPVVLTDDDVSAAVKLAGPRDVVQLISYTTNRASFDRITEAAGLQIDE